MISIDDESLPSLIKKAATHGMEKREKETLVKNAGINSVNDAERHLNKVAFSNDTVCFYGANDRLFLCNKGLSTIGVLDANGPGTFLIIEEKKYDNKFEAKITKEQSRFEELGFKPSNIDLKEAGGIKALYPNLSDKGPTLPSSASPPNKGGLPFSEDQPKVAPPQPSPAIPAKSGKLPFFEDSPAKTPDAAAPDNQKKDGLQFYDEGPAKKPDAPAAEKEKKGGLQFYEDQNPTQDPNIRR